MQILYGKDLPGSWGKFGFLTCYDICFPQLVQELVNIKKVDALIVNAAWRKQGKRVIGKRYCTRDNPCYDFK